jgi:peptidoglycan L-alanyl-D-glutamate endopeptidase CwlK
MRNVSIVLVCVIGVLIFVVCENSGSAKTGQLSPMPTEINSNFENQVNECFIPVAFFYGYTLRISSGFRSVEEQNQIYQQGRVVNGHIVTEAMGGRSIHNFGFAVDVVDRWRGYDIDFDKLGKIAEYCGLESGDEGDLAHFEHRNGLTTDQFLDGFRPKDLILPCTVMDEKFKASQSLSLEDLRSCDAPKF